MFFFASRRRHTRCYRDWSSDVCSSDLVSITGSPAGSVLPGTEVDFHANISSQFGWQNLWSLSSPRGSSSSLAGNAGDFTYFIPDVPGVYKVTSTITDDLGNVASASILVHVQHS